MHRQRALKLTAFGLALLGLFWLGGLAWFVQSSLTIGVDHTTPTDAIVVLTGGRLRVETALNLLGAGRAQKLFISGVNPHVDRVALLRVTGRMDDTDATRIEIGHDAENTLGNARETAEWMQRQGYRSLRLVTSWYHMRRSLLEFERAMPDAIIVAEPVIAAHNDPQPLSEWFDIAVLTMGEYNKFLVTLARPEIAIFWPRAALWNQASRSAEGAATSAANRWR
ncbi:MAG TPA: YdcF family protein [Stellaceae bacterium]|nr:YdcF family protein [Stellaceae bacterium]